MLFQPLVNDVLVLGHWDLRSLYVPTFPHEFHGNCKSKITVHKEKAIKMNCSALYI